MSAGLRSSFVQLAEAFRYPSPGLLESLEAPAGGAKNSYTIFLEKIGRLSLGEWEELYTRTLDLNPPAAPYIGFQTWGESYQRGEFLSKMSRALLETGIDTSGELPDHLAPILLYLGQAEEPLPELLDVFAPALQRMQSVLRKDDPANPYLDLLESVESLWKEFSSTFKPLNISVATQPSTKKKEAK